MKVPNPQQLSQYSIPSTIFQICESIAVKLLQRIQIGRLLIVKHDGILCFGDDNSLQRARITVKKPQFWIRILLFSTLGFGESFINDEIEFDDIFNVLQIFVLNRDFLGDGKAILPFGLNYVLNRLFTTRIQNSINNALGNISAHYDLGNDMFESFLDPTMMYSCPIWTHKDESLEQAQINKIHSLIKKLNSKRGQHILEVGTGWGSLAIEAASKFGLKVTTITLSKQQQMYAVDRIQKLGLEDKISVQLVDYRDLNPATKFDHIISCEMLEAVGPEYLQTYFQKLESVLKPNGNICIQVITMPESRYEAYCQKTDFIQKHIFPGGHCPSVTAITNASNQATRGILSIDNIENIGPHYAKCLRQWRKSFLQNIDSLGLYDDYFKRKWEFYFAYCEIGFASRTLGVMHIRFTRCNNTSLIGDIPLV